MAADESAGLFVFRLVLQAVFRTTTRLNIFLKAEQSVRPELLVPADPPFVDLPDRHSIQRIHSLTPFFACIDQIGFTQHVDVLHHPKAGQVRKRFDDRGGRSGASTQQIQNRPPGRIRQRFPNGVKVSGHQARWAATPSEKSLPMLSRICRQPLPRPSRCAASSKPIARCRRVTLVPPAIWSRRSST